MISKEQSLEFPISLGNIKDQLAALLYAAGRVLDNQDISKFELGNIDWNAPNDTLIPVKLKVKTQERMEVIHHDK